MNTAQSLPAVKTLCVLVTGEDAITEENASAAFPLLVPFVQRQEIVADSVAEANRLRAEVGKPPIGKPVGNKAARTQPAGQPSSPPTGDQLPQGG